MCVFDGFVSDGFISNGFVSSTKVFISSMKHVRLQRRSVCLQCKMCLSLAVNLFICSVLSYLKVSSRKYLVMDAFICRVILYLEASCTNYFAASNEYICLQCDIEVKRVVFGRNAPQKNRNWMKSFCKLSSEDGPKSELGMQVHCV